MHEELSESRVDWCAPVHRGFYAFLSTFIGQRATHRHECFYACESNITMLFDWVKAKHLPERFLNFKESFEVLKAEGKLIKGSDFVPTEPLHIDIPWRGRLAGPLVLVIAPACLFELLRMGPHYEFEINRLLNAQTGFHRNHFPDDFM
jgi:hypothetical protein